MKRPRASAILAAAAMAIVGAHSARAAINFESLNSFVDITHDPSTFNTGDTPRSVHVLKVPTYDKIYPYVSTYQLDSPFAIGSSTTHALASLGHSTNSTSGSFKLASGSGVSQDDPGDNFKGYSTLTWNVNLWW